MRRNYHVINRQGKPGERQLAEFFRTSGQQVLPMVELIEQCRLAVDEVIEVLGRKTIETILEVSAQQIAGPRAQGQAGGAVRRHGHQHGRVRLAGRQLRVQKPRLRQRGRGAGDARRRNPDFDSAPRERYGSPVRFRRSGRHCFWDAALKRLKVNQAC